MPTVTEKRVAFRRLHETGCFVMPNPWDAGSARYLQHLGFPALATTSAGAAFAMGLPDNGVPRDAILDHIRAIVDATERPVNADFEAGFAPDPEGVAANVRLCCETGVAGLSIEDSTGDASRPLYERALAVERIRAAREVTEEAGVVLTARAECFVVGRPDLDDVLRRLTAYAAAGADCLYAPGLQTREQIRAVVEAMAPKPVNVLGGRGNLAVGALAELGVRRVSVGSALARMAWGGFMRAAGEIARAGTFEALVDAVPYTELDAFFRDDRRGRS